MATLARIIGLSLLAAIVPLDTAAAQDGGPAHDVVKVAIVVDGTLIATPEYLLTPGGTASSQHVAPDGYSMKVMLGGGEGDGGAGRVLRYELYLRENGQWVLGARPTITTLLNQPSSMSFRTRSGKDVTIRSVVESRRE